MGVFKCEANRRHLSLGKQDYYNAYRVSNIKPMATQFGWILPHRVWPRQVERFESADPAF